MKIRKKDLIRIIESIIKEGMPTSGRGGFAGLFSDEMRSGFSSDYDEDEFTEELIDYSSEPTGHDIDRSVMRTPPSRTRNIPQDVQNPYVPGETYADTTQRVMRQAEEFLSRQESEEAKSASKKRAANREFLKSHQGSGTGVVPHNEPYGYDSSSEEITQGSGLTDLLDSLKDVEFTFSEPPPGDTTKVLNRKDTGEDSRVQEGKSRGSLIRSRYYGRY